MLYVAIWYVCCYEGEGRITLITTDIQNWYISIRPVVMRGKEELPS